MAQRRPLNPLSSDPDIEITAFRAAPRQRRILKPTIQMKPEDAIVIDSDDDDDEIQEIDAFPVVEEPVAGPSTRQSGEASSSAITGIPLNGRVDLTGMDTGAPPPVPRSSSLADSEADEPRDPLPPANTTNSTTKRRNLVLVEPILQALSDLRDEHDRVVLAQEIQAEKERYEKETIEFEWGQVRKRKIDEQRLIGMRGHRQFVTDALARRRIVIDPQVLAEYHGQQKPGRRRPDSHPHHPWVTGKWQRIQGAVVPWMPAYVPQYRAFKKASGGVNAIAQCGTLVAVASNVLSGDQYSTANRRIDIRSENKEGSVLFWEQTHDPHCEQVTEVLGHWHEASRDVPEERDDDGNIITRATTQTYPKYYSVTDVKVDPTRVGRFVTAGKDGHVQVWQASEGASGPRGRTLDVQEMLGAGWGPDTYGPNTTPHSISFREDTSLFGVSHSNGSIILHDLDEPSLQINPLVISNPTEGKGTSCLFWGRGDYSNCIFGGTESADDEELIRGDCKMFDVETGTETAFGSDRSVGQMTMDSTGHNFIIISNGHCSSRDTADDPSRHVLTHYDLRASFLRPTYQQKLGSFSSDSAPGMIISVSWSQDDLYLAIARNDNRVDVFDGRFFGRPLFRCEHGPGSNMSGEKWGVTAMQWVTSNHSRRGSPSVLVTGGDDGQVKVWDLRRAIKDTGYSIVQMDGPIGAMHIGDTYRGERPLIVGDCDGQISEHCEPGQQDDAVPWPRFRVDFGISGHEQDEMDIDDPSNEDDS